MQWRNHLKRWHLSWIRRVRIGLIRPCLPRRPIGGAVRWRAQPVGAGSAFMARQRRRSAVENRGSRPPPFQKAVDSQPKGCIYWSTAYWLQAGLRHHEPAPQWRALYFNHGAKLFAAIWRKDPSNPTPAASIYNHSLQVLTERFHYHCVAEAQPGIMVVDGRTKALDFGVAAGHLSFLFGHPVGRTYTTIVEAPLFADSRLSAGIQLADIVGACIYGNYYQKRCSTVSGHVEGDNPISAQRLAAIPAEQRGIRTPIRDYTHCGRYWSAIEALRFKRTDVPPPTGGNTVPGYYGFRELGGAIT
jgi:hypothetical protein